MQKAGTKVPGEALATRVADLISRFGMSRASAETGVGREALARIAARLTVRAGTIALVEQRLQAIASASNPPPAPPAAA